MGSLAFVFLFKYLSPLLFVIGLMYFVYGCIEYFVVGLGGDEERAQNGRNAFLRSINWFVVALLVYGVISTLAWLSGFPNPVTDTGREEEPRVRPGDEGGEGGGLDVKREQNVLPVPNVPQR